MNKDTEKCFPRYDDLKHIDSSATAKKGNKKSPDPEAQATTYTEAYLRQGNDS